MHEAQRATSDKLEGMLAYNRDKQGYILSDTEPYKNKRINIVSPRNVTVYLVVGYGRVESILPTVMVPIC